MSQAGALMAVLTGALRPGEGLEAGGPMHKCRHCPEGWALLTSRHPIIQKTQHLVEVARRDNHPATISGGCNP
eukprot:6155362-Karenia_brevis.AAC.1